MRPSIGTITGVGMIALLAFSLLGFFYNYTKANDVKTTINTALGNYAALAKPYIPDTMILAAGELYIWIGSSAFTKIGDVTTQVTQMVGQLSTQAKAVGINVDITAITSVFIPSPMFFYIFAIIAGFAGGILLLKKESKFLDAAFAPIYPAMIYTVIFAVASMLIASMIKSNLGQASSFIPDMGIGFMDYVKVFMVMYVFILIGTMAAAAVRHVTGARGAQAPAVAQVPAVEEKEDEEETEEEPEEEKQPKAAKQQAGYCSKCKRQNKANAKFCTKCGVKL